MVRAKFICTVVSKRRAVGWWDPKGTHHAGESFLYEYEFMAVTGDGAEENKDFFASTPSGEIKLRAVRDDLFEPGQEYYLDFAAAS